MTLEQIKEVFKDLSDGIRAIYLIHRSKEGGLNNTHKRHIKKAITTNSEEFFKAIEEFKQLKDNDERELRIYASQNSRDLNKAIRLFKQRQLNRDYDEITLRDSFYLHISGQFISCLSDSSSKSESNFLFDLDECCERGFMTNLQLIEKLTTVITSYKTKNGYHIITKAFNYTVLDEVLIKCIHKDDLMLIDF